ncbi:MAG: hypothetical protein JWO61_293 [Candidatus Saccharibacteria bacterium]|nr:hypothetical protein [Candidatus Saccharibacteria bacterium]
MMNSKLVLALIGGGVLLLIILILFIVSSNGGTKTVSLERLGLRLQTLQKITTDAQKNIKSSSLRSINSNLKTSLINTNRDIASPLTAAKVDLKKTDKQLVTEENGEALTASLENARLNATFDRTYAKEMAYQLDRTTVLMNSLLKSTKSTSLKTFLGTSTKDLSALQKQFAQYNSANS